jgi:predicted ABC-type ATPase
VRQRHLKGGHNVPSGDVRRRFVPSLVNFFRRYLPLADEALLFNAAAYPPQLIARWAGGQKDVIDARRYEAVLRQAKV